MHNAFGNYDCFSGVNRWTVLGSTQQPTTNDVKAVSFRACANGILARPAARLTVDLAERLVIPLVGALFYQAGDVDDVERFVENIEPRVVGEPRR